MSYPFNGGTDKVQEERRYPRDERERQQWQARERLDSERQRGDINMDVDAGSALPPHDESSAHHFLHEFDSSLGSARSGAQSQPNAVSTSESSTPAPFASDEPTLVSSSLLEYVAASRLLPALRGALSFALRTISPRLLRFRLLRFLLMKHEQKTTHAVLFVLEWYCFATTMTTTEATITEHAAAQASSCENTVGKIRTLRVSTSSFSEDMYGLKRMATMTQPHPSKGKQRRPLLASPFVCALISVLPMYIEASLREKAKQELEQQQRWQERQQEFQHRDGENSYHEDQERRDSAHVESGRRRWDAHSAFSSLMALLSPQPSIRSRDDYFWRRCVAAWEGVRVAYSLLYLVKATKHPSLGYHILGARMVPTTVADIKQRREQSISSRSWLSHKVSMVGGEFAGNMTSRLVSALYNYGQPAVLCSLLGFQMIHWWFTTGEVAVNKKEKEKNLIPPPPPCPGRLIQQSGNDFIEIGGGGGSGTIQSIDEIIGAMEDTQNRIQILRDTSLCALCRETRKNPCTLTVSGYCFCYPCAIDYVRTKGRCPISLLECKEEHIRRLHL